MAKNVNTTSDDVRTSVASIYSDLLEKRRIEREEREEKKRQERELRQQEKEESKLSEDGTKLSKKERQEAALDNWKEVIVGLTGDDLEYSSPKKGKKKYHKWIDDEEGQNVVLTPKTKKAKKQNYQKQFEPELNMLKTIVADQNRFTADLQKRFNIAAGPATKDAAIPSKTLVELASVINAGRSNSLGVLREVGNLKKTIADLYMKQKKLDADTGSSGFNTTDIGLMGSNIAASIFGDDQTPSQPMQQTGGYQQAAPAPQQTSPIVSYPQPSAPGQVVEIQAEVFDPDTWEGPSISSSSMINFEAIPHEVVVVLDKNSNAAKFKAVRTDTGAELNDYPVPTTDISKLKINEQDKTVKGEFDELYKLEIV